jgi:hypothetical protein
MDVSTLLVQFTSSGTYWEQKTHDTQTEKTGTHLGDGAVVDLENCQYGFSL